jgi:predicted MFS family arabinose efflux permease
MRAVLIVTALFLSGLGAAAQFGKMSVLFDDLARVYAGQGAVALGLVVSVVGMVGLVFGTTAGLLVARIGPRRAILWAMLGGATVSAAQALLPPFPVLLALRLAEGLSHLAIVVVGPTMIAAVSAGPRQGAAMALWSTFFGLCYAALALVGPPLLAWGGAAALLLAHAAWMVACAAALALLLPPDPAPPPGAAGPGLLAEHAAIYASPRVAAPALGFVFYTALYVALLTLLPPLLPDPQRALVATAMPLVSIAVSLTLGVWLLPRLGPVRLVQAGYSAAALAAVALALSPGPETLAAAAIVLAGALGLVQGASFAAIPALNLTPQDRARAAGAVAQMGNVGTTTGTPLLAWLIAQAGPGAVPAFALLLSLAGIAMHGWLAARRRETRA